MKTSINLFLLTALLTVVFVQAQDFAKEEPQMKHSPFLRPGLERYLDKVGMGVLAKDDFRLHEDEKPGRPPVRPFNKWRMPWEDLTIRRFDEQGFMERVGDLSQDGSSAWPTNAHTFFGDVDTAWVRHYASRLVPSEDMATDIAIDSEGNVYVTGYSSSPPFGSRYVDYLTIKYNTTGIEIWRARYNGSGHGDNVPSTIHVDGSGNVYVTGWSWDSVTGRDYATIKYNTSGIEQWAVRYNGTGNGFDEANALAVDPAGNVYVTGYSKGLGTGNDYVAVKYNFAGAEQWVARYNGPGSGEDYTTAIALDANSNVYVTGHSEGSGTRLDYATIKYNSVGAEQWVTRYHGLGNGSDQAAALAVDLAGNVYVTGSSAGTGTNSDYATVKYNTAGVQQWAARYNGPVSGGDYTTALALDANGNVYITGWSLGSNERSDYVTIKYSPTGVQQWVARYNGPGNDWDEATALLIDANGNVFVTGKSRRTVTSFDYVTIKYNTTGTEQWAVPYSGATNFSDWPTALALDISGNVFVTGRSWGSGTDEDYATIKYNTAGVEQWVARYNGPVNSGDYAYDLAVDASGNVLVTGHSRVSGLREDYSIDDHDYATIKYNSAGTEQMIMRYNGPEGDWDGATAIAVDGDGNYYVTGQSSGLGTSYDYATIKYSPAGLELWVARYNSAWDVATALAVDAAGNVYVTGHSQGLGTDYDYATVKYNAAGAQQWVSRYNGPVNRADYATGLAVDTAGNVYVIGYSWVSSSDYDYVTVKYNTLGVEQWVAQYKGPGNGPDGAAALAVDAAGNVYVTGGSQGSGTAYDYATIKYNAAGAEQWIARYNGPVNNGDYATALSLDDNGSVYVTGSSDGVGTRDDYTTIKYNSAGTEQWVARYNGPVNNGDFATALSLDNNGNVYVTGWSLGSSMFYDYATVKYNSNGVEQWVARYNGPGNTDDKALALAVDANSNVYVTGRSYGTGWSIYTTIKYTQSLVSVEEKETSQPTTYLLSQNYPNPFNPATTITFSLPRPGHITLQIFNTLGKEITTLINQKLNAGQHRVIWEAKELASGIYFYRLQSEGKVLTRKMILMR